MPRKNREERYAYQRAWYAKNSKKVVAKVRAHKKKQYRGVCVICGGPTQGMDYGSIPIYCSKPSCASAQRRGIGKITPKRFRPQIVSVDALIVTGSMLEKGLPEGWRSLMRTTEVAEFFGVSRTTIIYWVRKKKIRPAFRHPAFGYFFQRELIEAYMKELEIRRMSAAAADEIRQREEGE